MARDAMGDKRSTKPSRRSDKTYARSAKAAAQRDATDTKAAEAAYRRHIEVFDYEGRISRRYLRRTGRL